jgi:hypothetical protein
VSAIRSAIRHHDELFPLVLIEWEGEASDAELQAHLEQLDAYGRSTQKRLVVYDLRRGVRVGHAQRQQLSRWIHRNAELVRTMNLAVFFVTASPVERIILRAILFAQPLGCPTRTFPDLDEALGEAARRFEAADNHLTALRLRARLARAGATPGVGGGT